MNSLIKAIVFCRVSTKEQADEGYSLEAQEKLLSEYAAKYNFQVVRVFKISESASGKHVRTVFNDMLQFATKEKVDAILCEKIDRLTRNLKDAATVDDWVRAKDNRSVHFVKESFILNQQTRAHDNLVWDMKVAIARFYTNNLSEEVRKGYAEKLAQGWMPKKAPLGYKTIGEKGHKTHVINEAEAPIIRSMFERYATGNYSLARLEFELYQEGFRTRSGKRVSISHVHRLLKDVFYYGVIPWKGQIVPGKHEPLITKNLFDKVQVIMKRQIKNPHFTKHTALFKALIYCQYCGGMVTWYIKKGHWYGHCNNHGLSKLCEKKTCMREERVEEQLFYLFDLLAPINEAVLQLMIDMVREEYQGKIQSRETEISRLTALLQQTRKRKDQVYEDKLDGKIDLAYYERKFAEYTTEEKQLEDALIKTRECTDEYQQLGVAIHELAYYARKIYELANRDEKRLLMTQFFTNLVQNQHEIKPNYTLAAEYLQNWIPKLNKNYEPQKTQSVKGKSDVFTSPHSIWLERWDSNPRPTG